MIGILCSIDLHVSIASNPERYRPLHCHFHFGYDIEGRQRIGYVRSHKLLVDDTRQSTGRSLLFLSISSLITARSGYCSTLYTGMPTIRLSCLDCVLRSAARLIIHSRINSRIYKAPLQEIYSEAKSLKEVGKIRSCHQKLAQTCPKYSEEKNYWGKGDIKIIIDESLGVSQLRGKRARCVHSSSDISLLLMFCIGFLSDSVLSRFVSLVWRCQLGLTPAA